MLGTSALPITLPGPRPLPIIGRFGNKLLFYRDPIAYHRHVYQTYGLIAAMVQGGTKVLIYDPEYNRQVMSQADIFYKEAFPGDPDSALGRIGSGFASLNGDAHRKHRRLVMPFLHKKHIQTYCDTMAALTDCLLDEWRTGEVCDMAQQIRMLTLHNSSRTLFGIDTMQHAYTIAHTMDQWLKTLTSIPVRLFPFDMPGTPFRRLLVRSEELEKQIHTWVDQERAQPSNQSTILHLLMATRDEDGAEISNADLVDYAATLFFAGFETTSIALTWVLFLLAQHPDVAADLSDEIQGVLQGAPPTIESLSRLHLLEMVIKESLRLLPPTYQSSRIAMQPFELGPYQFPAGTKVMYSQYITHRLPALYDQPNRFLPRRWETISPSAYEYFPFLTGARMCIGAAFAMLEMKIFIAMIFQRYRLALPLNAKVDRDAIFFLQPKGGMPMCIHPQDHQFSRPAVRGNIHEMVDLA